MSGLRLITKRWDELAVGDALEFLGKLYRISGFEPYDGPLDCVEDVICVDGYGPFMSRVRGPMDYRVGA